MIEVTETFVFLVVSSVIMSGFAAAVIPPLLKHQRQVAREERKIEEAERRAEVRLGRFDAFEEITHKAQLADLARDCIAGRETWIGNKSDEVKSD